jgi:hypothetical protein
VKIENDTLGLIVETKSVTAARQLAKMLVPAAGFRRVRFIYFICPEA